MDFQGGLPQAESIRQDQHAADNTIAGTPTVAEDERARGALLGWDLAPLTRAIVFIIDR